ncbi:MAG: CHAD domain-containing protein [Acidobacteriota bacterium]
MQPLIEKELLLDSHGTADILNALGEQFTLRTEAELDRHATYWDTFDWRVWNAGGVLAERPATPDVRALVLEAADVDAKDRRELAWCDHAGQVRELAWLQGEDVPGMADNLPAGFEDLAPVLSMRRLLPILYLRESGPLLRVLDDSEKTVLRLQVLESSAARDEHSPSQGMPTRLRILPVRGYGAFEAKVLRFLADSFRLAPAELNVLESGLSAIGRRPGDYTSKVKLKLKRRSTALEASQTIYGSLLDAMLINEPGLRADLDSEFLHDFRVAVRRTRSALSQVKGVFADDVVEHFKNQFRWLGQITGPTRDLDVYLLKMPTYRADLPEASQEHLEPLERFLVERQAAEQRELVRQLDSARYRDLIDTWRLQLARPSTGPLAEAPVVDVASARVWKLYRRMVKAGRAITDETPAEALHDVRIVGKKLRYLMEFFRSLYAKKEIDTAIRELKRLQDLLGDFNDYEVQEAAMGQFAVQLADSMKAHGQDSAPSLLAMGRLQAHLDDGRTRERWRFAERFERFASVENRARFRALFHSP